MILRNAKAFAAVCCVASLAQPLGAQAIELSKKGTVVYLSGPIKSGDNFVLKNFLAANASPPAKLIMLNSNGGYIEPALEMARLIRKGGLNTGVDAARARCESACTGIFSGGVQRYYFGAGNLKDGDEQKRGLGFHQGNAFDASGRRTQSGPASAHMINIYYEMGIGGAAQYVTRADARSMFRLSAATAQQSGLATSLSAP